MACSPPTSPVNPNQSREIVDGEPVFVATWTGTITPSTDGPSLSRWSFRCAVGFRGAGAATVVSRSIGGRSLRRNGHRPFRSVEHSADVPVVSAILLEHVRAVDRSGTDDAVTLKASSPPIEVKALPVAGQPGTFSGAVGRFDIRASVASSHAVASEPITLRITVQGDGDLDRVNLPDIATSNDWKAYPATSKIEAPAPGKRYGRKTFEQVLIPLHGGSLTIPSVVLPVFDPASGRYTGRDLAGHNRGRGRAPALGVQRSDAKCGGSSYRGGSSESVAEAPSAGSLVESPRELGLRLVPVLVVLLGAASMRLWRRGRDEEKALRRTLRRTAKGGRVVAFFDAARRLIVVHYAKRWGVAEGVVTPTYLREHLGTSAEPLLAAIASADALRFGRRNLEPTELSSVCSSIETTLRDAR